MSLLPKEFTKKLQKNHKKITKKSKDSQDFENTPTPWLTRIHLTQISKCSHSSLKTYNETEIPLLTRIFLEFE
jgi:hypothetical protein